MKLLSGEDLDADAILGILQRMAKADQDLDKNIALAIQEYRIDVRDRMIQQQQDVIRGLQKKVEDNGNDSKASEQGLQSDNEPEEAPPINRDSAK